MKKYLSIILIVIIISLFLFFLCVFLLFPIKYKDYVKKYSQEFNIDERLVYTVINIESGFDSDSVSKAGAIGLMQLLPTTAEDMAKKLKLDLDTMDLFDEETNIRLGCSYLAYLLELYDGNVINSLCAYNWGLSNVNNWISEGNVDPKGTIIKIPVMETKNYITKYRVNNWVYKTLRNV